jgi:hypothetical protein
VQTDIGLKYNMEIVFDEYLKFPLPPYMEEDYNALHKACGSVEDIEENFDIEFSCGDGKYLSDFWQWMEFDNPLEEEAADKELKKYDGNVCTNHPPRHREDKKQFKVDKPYRFTIKYSETREELMFSLNGKKISSKWVG